VFARVAAYEGRDRGRTDALAGAMRKSAGSGGGLEGLRRLLLLAGRDDPIDLEVSVFGSTDAMHAAEPAFERIAAELGDDARGRRMTLQVYEVAVSQDAGEASCARVTRLEGSPDRLDDGVLFLNESIVPQIRELAGWTGLLVLVDRGTGSTRTMSLWDSPESLAATEEHAGSFGRSLAGALDESYTGFAQYDVVLDVAPPAS
jgi:hypothetical protein